MRGTAGHARLLCEPALLFVSHLFVRRGGIAYLPWLRSSRAAVPYKCRHQMQASQAKDAILGKHSQEDEVDAIATEKLRTGRETAAATGTVKKV